jgi:type IV pilus assembly protein PilB
MAARKKVRARKSAAAKSASAKEKGAGPKGRGNAGGEVIGMDEAIALLKTTRPTFYRWLRAGKIKGMKAGRQWRFYRSEVDRFLKGEEPRVELPVSIGPLVEELVERARDMGVKGMRSPLGASVGAAIELIVRLAVELRASDVHIEPFATHSGGESVGVIRYRIDGVLHPVVEFDLRLMPALIEALKSAAACDVHEKRKPQDGRILTKVGERGVDLRVSFVGPVVGESATIRLLDPAAVRLTLDRIDFAARDRERLTKAIRATWGLVVLTGPTGSGKTTVLYSCLNELAGPGIKTMSLEDPVEYLLPWVTQIAINPAKGVTFETGARSILRSAPNVIMIGEIRNRESLAICQQAALTGHLVFTTLHTDEAVGALRRMVDIGSEPFVVAESTRMVVAQRLVRTLCPECSTPQEPVAEALHRAAELARGGGLDWDSLRPNFRAGAGCAKCGRTGFRGRTVIAEMLEMTPEISRALRDGADNDELRAIAVSQGMTTMAADGIRRAASGQVALTEILHVLGLK